MHREMCATCLMRLDAGEILEANVSAASFKIQAKSTSRTRQRNHSNLPKYAKGAVTAVAA
eukprot:160692-Amphidinium_carterae.3